MRDDRLRRVKVRKKTDVLQGHGPQRLRAVQENIADLVSKVGALEVLPVLLGHAISERLRRNKGHLLDLPKVVVLALMYWRRCIKESSS